MTRRVLTAEEFARAAKADELSDDIIVRSGFAAEVKASDDGDAEGRTLQFTISTADVDRMDDTIAVDGWRLENYRKNPVVLWCHDYELLPVAKAPRVWIEADRLKALAEFTPPGMAKFNDTVFDMYKGGFLSAVSVGFKPIKWRWVDDDDRPFGLEFEEQELLEFSCCPVPANPNALIDARAKGISTDPLVGWASKTLLGASPDGLELPADEVSGLFDVLVKVPGQAKDALLERMEHFIADRSKAGGDEAARALDFGRKLIGANIDDVLMTRAAHTELLAKADAPGTGKPRLMRAALDLAQLRG